MRKFTLKTIIIGRTTAISIMRGRTRDTQEAVNRKRRIMVIEEGRIRRISIAEKELTNRKND